MDFSEFVMLLAWGLFTPVSTPSKRKSPFRGCLLFEGLGRGRFLDHFLCCFPGRYHLGRDLDRLGYVEHSQGALDKSRLSISHDRLASFPVSLGHVVTDRGTALALGDYAPGLFPLSETGPLGGHVGLAGREQFGDVTPAVISAGRGIVGEGDIEFHVLIHAPNLVTFTPVSTPSKRKSPLRGLGAYSAALASKAGRRRSCAILRYFPSSCA